MNVYLRIHGQGGHDPLVAPVFLWLSLAEQEQTEEDQTSFFLVGCFAGLQCCSEYECVSLGISEFLLSVKTNSWYTFFFLFQYILFYLMGFVNNNSLTCTWEQCLFDWIKLNRTVVVLPIRNTSKEKVILTVKGSWKCRFGTQISFLCKGIIICTQKEEVKEAISTSSSSSAINFWLYLTRNVVCSIGIEMSGWFHGLTLWNQSQNWE